MPKMDNPPIPHDQNQLSTDSNSNLDQANQNQPKATSATPKAANQIDDLAEKQIVDQVGQLTRTLHNSLRELGYDKRLEKITAEVPDAQDKLSYIVAKTEQAAECVLNATEIAMPIQDKLSSQATYLSQLWHDAFERQQIMPTDTEKFKELLIQTLSFLGEVPKQTQTTNAHLREIMMAQDFQDLTGQVIKNVNRIVQDLEVELLRLLVNNTSIKKKETNNHMLLNGPVTNPEKNIDALTSQKQVDDLLESLGF